MQQQKKVDAENVRHPVSQLVRLHVPLEIRSVQTKKINKERKVGTLQFLKNEMKQNGCYEIPYNSHSHVWIMSV